MEKCDFVNALPKLESAAELFLSQGKSEEFLECKRLVLRIHLEMANEAELNNTKERIQDMVLNQRTELSSKTYYTLGICSVYKSQHKAGVEYFQKALALALSKDNKDDMAHAIYGLSQTYFWLGRHEESLKEIYNLQVFFEVLDVPQLKQATKILNGFIQLKLNRTEEALDIFWQAFDTIKEQKNLFMYFYVLYAIGIAYQELGDKDLARVYLKLADRSIDENNMRVLSQMIDKKLNELGVEKDMGFDLIVKEATNSVIERKKGKVDFKNQFILLDLLHLLAKSPGQVYSKESIVKRIWSQKYDPSVHDNKIYVTIKRLRKLIEPDYDKPKYISRSRNGYHLIKSAKIHFDS
ncbi:MAG: winged helix-turn-helix domain-containing protein, partial [Bdellovibrionales bacterium]|nr:winged helix-turn-helix domain-containing protein [Bdellovibrionales bacterium]